MPTILDSTRGMIPVRTPLESEILRAQVTPTDEIFIGMPVTISGGYLTPHTAGATEKPCGVALEYAIGAADDSTWISVCVSPSMVYKVKGNDAYARANLNQVCVLASNGGNSDTGHSTAVMSTSTLSGTRAVASVFTCVGQDTTVTNDTDPQYYLFKINDLQLESKFDATV